MLKTGMYYLLVLTTIVRFADLIYLLTRDALNLPIAVLLVTTAMVIYGIVLAVKKVLGNVRFKQLTTFYLVQSAMIVFNLAFVAVAWPLKIGFFEIIAIGTFLDLFVNAVVLYLGTRQLRSGYVTVQQRF